MVTDDLVFFMLCLILQFSEHTHWFLVCDWLWYKQVTVIEILMLEWMVEAIYIFKNQSIIYYQYIIILFTFSKFARKQNVCHLICKTPVLQKNVMYSLCLHLDLIKNTVYGTSVKSHFKVDPNDSIKLFSSVTDLIVSLLNVEVCSNNIVSHKLLYCNLITPSTAIF